MGDEIFDLIGIRVRGAHFNRVRQVQNHRMLRRAAKRFHHASTDCNRIVHFGAGKAFRGIFIAEIGSAAGSFFGEFAHQFGAFHRNVDDTVHVFFKYDLALQRGGGVVKMDDNIFGTADGFECFFDEVRSGLHQNLQPDIVRNKVLFNQRAADFVFGFGRGRESDFDFLESDPDQRLKEIELLFQIHRRHQRLIAVAQVNGAPHRCFGDGVVRPLTPRHFHRNKRMILFVRRIHNKHCLSAPVSALWCGAGC